MWLPWRFTPRDSRSGCPAIRFSTLINEALSYPMLLGKLDDVECALAHDLFAVRRRHDRSSPVFS